MFCILQVIGWIEDVDGHIRALAEEVMLRFLVSGAVVC